VILEVPSTLDQLEKHFWWWEGHQIVYSVTGSGIPLLLIHGFGACIGHWRKNIPVLSAAGYKVFAIDLLGFGDSDKAPVDYSLQLWERLIIDFWQDHIGSPTVFVGNSIGALLSLMVVSHHPRVSLGAVLINSAGGLSHRPSEFNPMMRWVMQCFAQLVKSPLTGPLLFNFIRQRGRIRETLLQVYCDHEAVTDELVDMLYEPSCHPGAQKVFASIVTAPPGPSPNDLLPMIHRPLLVLWGDSDPWTPITSSNIYQEYAQAKAIQFIPIPNAGHCPHDECPQIVNQLILDWLPTLTQLEPSTIS
jgi:pimeloyl-ACP methyl ester carboxylesterase